MDDSTIVSARPLRTEGIGALISYARELRALGQGELAEALKIPQARLHRYENDLATPRPEDVAALSEHLRVPMSFWSQPATVATEPCWRSTRMTARELRRVKRQGQRIRDTVWRAIAAIEFEPSLPFRTFAPDDYDGTDAIIGETIAAELRVLWGIPPGPIRNLTEYVEGAGFLVQVVDFGNDQVDAFTWSTLQPRVILLAAGRPGCRRRMSLSHELAHHVMGHIVEHERADKQAKAFAGAFLLPADDFTQTWPSLLTVDTLIQLKQHWGVSVQAMLYRAHALNLIEHRVYMNWVIRLTRGGKKNDPGHVVPERPATIRQLLDMYTSELGIPRSELADSYGWIPEEFLSVFTVPDQKTMTLKAPLPSTSVTSSRPVAHDEKIIQMPTHVRVD